MQPNFRIETMFAGSQPALHNVRDDDTFASWLKFVSTCTLSHANRICMVVIFERRNKVSFSNIKHKHFYARTGGGLSCWKIIFAP